MKYITQVNILHCNLFNKEVNFNCNDKFYDALYQKIREDTGFLQIKRSISGTLMDVILDKIRKN